MDPTVDANESDASSNEEDMEEDEGLIQKQIEELDENIKTSPYNYQHHVDRIELLRKIGEFEQLRTARKGMSNIFPLTKDLWLNWLEDEQKFAETDDDHKKLEELFELSTKDYLCPEIWLEYAQYSIRLIGNEGGIAKLRSIMERALSEVGLHVSKGSSVWEAYREIENAILMTMQPPPGSISSAEQLNRLSEQTDRVGLLFVRQLAIPLLDMENTMTEYQEWRKSVEDGEINIEITESYQESLSRLKKLAELENILEEAKMPKLDAYHQYIEYEKESHDPARVQCIYERAIADNCLNSDLWFQYIKYLVETIKTGPVVLSVHERSVRNCPWVAQLWTKYLICLERNKASPEKMQKVTSDALAAGFSSAGDYALLWQVSCDQARRRVTESDKENLETSKKSLHDVFKNATSHLLNVVLPAFNETGDPDFTLWCYWARCEARLLSNIAQAREVLDDVLEDVDARRKWSIWLDYFQIEMEFGDVKKARTVLRKALQSTAADDGSAESAASHLIQFEREFGSLEDLEDATRKVEGRMAKVAKRKEKVATHFQNKTKRRQQNPQSDRKEKVSPKSGQDAKKRPRSSKSDVDFIPEKRQRNDKDEIVQDTGFKAPSGLPARLAKPKSKLPEQGQGEKPKANAKPPPPGFHQTTTGNTTTNAKPLVKIEPTNDLKSDEGKGQKFTPTAESDERTIFVSNLGYSVENLDDKLHKIFGACGEVESVRLAKNNKGQIRGFAYVQFLAKSSVDDALKLDREVLEGRPMFVSPNVDKTKNPDFKVFKYDTGMERHKLFVSGLSFTTTEDELRQIFSQHGKLKSLRIVTTRSGKPKGLAYVEYETEADAAQAVMKTDQTVVGGFTITVAISNPPSRNKGSEDRTRQVSTNRGGTRGRARTQVNLLPRTLQRPNTTTDKPKLERDANYNEVKSQALSNKDFAKMFTHP
uniref:Squamous cell carcinoma antigen recognized by T-cells 3 n=1 Tax=Phallusia mammillata TaxID=59560 RepID=A0A6F9DRS1_9ASCI|nr:squamous cell carcinoma antigen recognized by T-cells 3 [Phallusia mammillata]